MRNFLTGIFMLITLGVFSQQVAKSLTSSGNVFIGFYEYKPTQYNVDVNTKYPLIIFLHGIGERGNGSTDLPRVLTNGLPRYINSGHPMRFFWNGKWETFLVLSPQLSFNYGDWPNLYVAEMVKYAKANLRIDTNRIFLTGLSLGGGGTWNYPYESVTNAKQLAAIAPVCGTCQFNGSWCNFSAAKLPVWAFHAQDDASVTVNCTTGTINNINSCNPAVKPYMTIWPTGNHWIWDRAFDTTYNWQNPNLYEWFLGQDKSKPVNSRPNANAGKDLTISTTTGMANLSGVLSQDTDGNIVRFIWRKISGPAGGNINTPVSATGLTRVSSLTIAGTYRFELKAIDDRADYTLDTISVIVTAAPVTNIPPVVEAGKDQTIATTNVTLNGTNSYDPDGFVVSYRWTRVAGPGQYTIDNPNIATPYVSNLGTGVYKFELQATDNLGAVNRDTITITETSELLPVQFVYVKSKKSGDVVEVSWATKNEYNTRLFEIETAGANNIFSKKGIVEASHSNDDTKLYSFEIDATGFEDAYCRIRQVNVDGTFTYSSIVSISNNSSGSILRYMPNPVKSILDLTLDNDFIGSVVIKFRAVDGRVIKTVTCNKQQAILNTTINLENLRTGIYLIEVNNGKYSQVSKIMKM